MDLFCKTISPKFPFKDAFQKVVEQNTHEFFAKYGNGRKLDKRRYYNDMAKIEAIAKQDAVVINNKMKTRLCWVEIKKAKNDFIISVGPQSLVESLEEDKDMRIQHGILNPFSNCIKWALQNDLEIPQDLDVKIYFWIADKPQWDISGLPIFIPSAIPGGFDLPLFPDVSYFYMQFDEKYAGKGLDFDQYKRLFKRKNNIDEKSVYFKGADTTKFNSNIRKSIAQDLEKALDGFDLSIEVGNVFQDFKPLYLDGLNKKYLLDLPGKFPWSIRFKMLFLFENNPTVIRVNERWVAHDKSWEDSETPWKQWADTIIPESCYLSLTHLHTQILKKDKNDRAVQKKVEMINKKAREKTVHDLARLIESGAEPEDPLLGSKLMEKLSTARIYQLMFRIILTIHKLEN